MISDRGGLSVEALIRAVGTINTDEWIASWLAWGNYIHSRMVVKHNL